MDDDEATRLFERGLGVDEFDDLPVASRDFVRNATKLSSALYLTAAYSVTLEKFILLAITVGTTLFFLNYHYEGHLLAARMRFTIITTAALFPLTFLIIETARRRENALDRLGRFKAVLTQVLASLLLWRWARPSGKLLAPGPDFDSEALELALRHSRAVFAILRLPSHNLVRHLMTARGTAFTLAVKARSRALQVEYLDCHAGLHLLVEKLKAQGLDNAQAIQVYLRLYQLQSETERVLTIKSQRTPMSARAFGRIIFVVTTSFYGVYYAYQYQTQLVSQAFTTVLAAVAMFFLGALASIHVAIEDPFAMNLSARFRGDVIDLASEERDAESRLQGIALSARRRAAGATGATGATGANAATTDM